jgi:hypothetical protein
MSDALNEYYLALERLKNGRPERVAKGTKINNDAVSLEAGRKKGTIKKSRPVFDDLINAISVASFDSRPESSHKEQVALAKAETAKYRVLWEEALAREVSLVKQLWSERAEWAAEKSVLTGEKVSSILGQRLHKKERTPP